MLNKFETIGIEKGYFIKMKIKDIPQSQCKESSIEVIDFDLAKDKLMTDLKSIGFAQDLKSCDCLKIIPELNRLEFIEIKGLKEYINRYHQSKKLKKPSKQVEKFEIDLKYLDSVQLLHILINKFSSELTDKIMKSIKRIGPVYIILTDVNLKNSRIRFTQTLNHLATRPNPKHFILRNELSTELKKAISSVTPMAVERYLFCEDELEEHYERLYQSIKENAS